MASKKQAALALLPGLDLSADFHALPSPVVDSLSQAMRAVGYRAPKNRNGSPARCFFEYLTRRSKTELMYVVQGNYGHGWEDLTASTSNREARQDLRDYRLNDPAPVRLIRRRVPVNN